MRIKTVLYGATMSKALTPADWIKQGFRTLAAEGAGGLKVDRLARSLGASRGSFYWHFRDLSHFQTALLEAWSVRAGRQVIAEVELAAKGTDRLRELMRRTMTSDRKIERAVRAWATHEPAVAKRLKVVDRERLDYLEKILKAAGLRPRQAMARASFIHWAYLGQMMLGDAAFVGLRPADLDEIARHIQAGTNGSQPEANRGRLPRDRRAGVVASA